MDPLAPAALAEAAAPFALFHRLDLLHLWLLQSVLHDRPRRAGSIRPLGIEHRIASRVRLVLLRDARPDVCFALGGGGW